MGIVKHARWAALALMAALGSDSLLNGADSFSLGYYCGERDRYDASLFSLASYSWAAPPKLDLPSAAVSMPFSPDPANAYSEAVAGRISPAARDAITRVYAPNNMTGKVDVIDPDTFQVVGSIAAGNVPQHVVPSWDLQTLWVTSDVSAPRAHGLLTPIDPKTGWAGKPIEVPDAYNMYFSPDGKAAIVVAEAMRRLEFRDPHTMDLLGVIDTPQCAGINHADFAIDGTYAIFTCEFANSLAKIDLVHHTVAGYLPLKKGNMPQDIRISPDGATFFVADLIGDGVVEVDGAAFKEIGYIATGVGTHGLYPSRDGTKLYVANRGTHSITGAPHSHGSVSVIDFASRQVTATWTVPNGGSPDMGNVSADGNTLWLSGRYDGVIYAFDTRSGDVRLLKVGGIPHGLTVWPQPGRYSLGHTGTMR